ncbi:MAG: hypothetical protein COB85_02045, partial [Bacteroidetes bacterium]
IMNAPIIPGLNHTEIPEIIKRASKNGATMSHKQCAITLYAFNILIISLAILSMGMESSYSLLIVCGSAVLIGQIPFIVKKKHD